MERSEPEANQEPLWGEVIVVRLLRRWVAARDAERNPLASIVELATNIGASPMAAIALDSLLLLTENSLGRRLRAECCCSPILGSDERAVLLMVVAARKPIGTTTSAEVPHGLPGALVWAATSVDLFLNDRLVHPVEMIPKKRLF